MGADKDAGRKKICIKRSGEIFACSSEGNTYTRQSKARQGGFEWENKEDVWKKVEEEIKELYEAVAEKNIEHTTYTSFSYLYKSPS